MPSPAIATRRPSACSCATSAALSLGPHLAVDLVDAESLRHGLRRGRRRRRSPSRCACPRARSVGSASGVVALIGSATAISPASAPSTARNITVAPSPRRRSAVARRAAPSTTPICASAPCCRARARCPSTVPAHADARCPTRSLAACEREPALRAPRATIACGERMLAALARGSRRVAAPRPRSNASGRDRSAGMPACLRSACRSCRRSACRPCAASRSPRRRGTARRRCAPRPVADHDRHRRREAQRARAGDDQHRHGVDAAHRSSAARARTGPRRGRSASAIADHRQHEPVATRGRPGAASARASAAPARPAARSARAPCRAPTCSARITRLPVPLCVAPISRSPGAFSTGIGSPVSIDSSTLDCALEHHAVDRHLLARAHAQPVADVHVGERHVLLAAVGAHAPRGLGREAQQRLDRGRGAASARVSSSTCPSSVSDTMTAAASKYTADAAVLARTSPGTDPGASVATTL